VVVKASGVGVFDDELLAGVMAAATPRALKIYWDVDAPATLAEIAPQPEHPLRRALPDLDFVLTYGGGPPVIGAYEGLGAKVCRPIYNALDPTTHHPVAPVPRYARDLNFLANRLPDRERRVEQFFIDAAQRLPGRSFLLGGNGWDDKPMPGNIDGSAIWAPASTTPSTARRWRCSTSPATAWRRSVSRPPPGCSRPPAPAGA
jgi:spore maturation protein CgeB